MIYLLNAPILTDYGVYDFKKISQEVLRAQLLLSGGFTSAVGHQGTADLLSKILGIPVPMNRVAIRMAEGDEAIVFRLKNRLAEGTVLTEEQLSQLDYEFGILERIE